MQGLGITSNYGQVGEIVILVIESVRKVRRTVEIKEGYPIKRL